MNTEDGNTTFIFIGGDIKNESLSWAEYIFDQKGNYLTNVLNIPTNSALLTPEWMLKEEKELNIPSGN